MELGNNTTRAGKLKLCGLGEQAEVVASSGKRTYFLSSQLFRLSSPVPQHGAAGHNLEIKRGGNVSATRSCDPATQLPAERGADFQYSSSSPL